MEIAGVHHIKLTVRELSISKDFYSKFPGFKIVADHEDFVMLSNNRLYIGLTTHKISHEEVFDEKRVGMDHLAFELSSLGDLQEAIIFLDENNIKHSEIQELSNHTKIIVFRDPDNIQLEFAFRDSK